MASVAKCGVAERGVVWRKGLIVCRFVGVRRVAAIESTTSRSSAKQSARRRATAPTAAIVIAGLAYALA